MPAGTFDTVRYIRTSQSVDEYWKSIEHGVVVKHIATANGVTITETLTAIKRAGAGTIVTYWAADLPNWL